MENPLLNLEPFEFDFITRLILATQRNYLNIVSEWNKMLMFFESFPDFASCFNSEYDLNEKYIIDDYRKVYNQMIADRKPGDLLKAHTFTLTFYSYEPELYKLWKKESVPMGEFDSTGALNTGCCIVMKEVTVNLSAFAAQYFSLGN
jgi:hypothetical protein